MKNPGPLVGFAGGQNLRFFLLGFLDFFLLTVVAFAHIDSFLLIVFADRSG